MPSPETDPKDLKNNAAAADTAARASSVKRGPGRPAAKPGEKRSPEVTVLPKPEADPVIEKFASGALDALVKIVHETRGWSDPGKQWRDNVAGCTARILAKYETNLAYADEMMLAGCLLMWAVPNLMMEAQKEKADAADAAKNPNPPGDDGKR